MNPFGYDAAELENTAKDLKKTVISMLAKSGSGHSASALGLAEVFSVLYFSQLSYDPHNPHASDRDRLILSPGHVCPILYAALAHSGCISLDELDRYGQYGSMLQGHPSRTHLPFVENSSGPLGQGISQAIGHALSLCAEKNLAHVYCILSDGEHNEGQVWEALLLIAKYALTNLTLIVDRNYIQIDGTTEEILPLEPLTQKYESFGFHVMEADGNSVRELLDVFEARSRIQKPTCIMLYTKPGNGVLAMQGKYSWHGKAPNEEEAYLATLELSAP